MPVTSRMMGNAHNRTTGITRANPMASQHTTNTSGSPLTQNLPDNSAFAAQRPGDIPQSKPLDVSGTDGITALTQRIEQLRSQGRQGYGELQSNAGTADLDTARAMQAGIRNRYGNDEGLATSPLGGMSDQEMAARYPDNTPQYGPRKTPITHKTADQYNQTSTFVVDDKGNPVLDDQGNFQETEYGRQLKQRIAGAEALGNRRKEQREGRIAKAEAYRASSPEAQRRVAEREIGKKRFRRISQEFGRDEAISAAGEGVGDFLTNKQNIQDREQASIADIAAENERQGKLEQARVDAGLKEGLLETEGEIRREGMTLEGDIASRHAREGAGYQQEQDVRRHQFGLERDETQHDFRTDEIGLEQDRMDQRQQTGFEQGETAADNQMERDRGTAEWRARFARENDPDTIQRRKNQLIAGLDESSMTPQARGQRTFQNIFGNGELAGTEESKRDDRNTRAFTTAHRLTPDSTPEDVFEAAKTSIGSAQSDEARRNAAKNIINTYRAFSSEDPKFTQEIGVAGGIFPSTRTQNAASKWAEQGLAIDTNDPEAVKKWLSNMPGEQTYQSDAQRRGFIR